MMTMMRMRIMVGDGSEFLKKKGMMMMMMIAMTRILNEKE